MELNFYERLCFELKKRNIKQNRFFADLNIARTTTINWKKGTIPNTETFFKICKYLNVSPEYLYYGIDENEELKVLRDKAAKYDEMIRFLESLK